MPNFYNKVSKRRKDIKFIYTRDEYNVIISNCLKEKLIEKGYEYKKDEFKNELGQTCTPDLAFLKNNKLIIFEIKTSLPNDKRSIIRKLSEKRKYYSKFQGFQEHQIIWIMFNEDEPKLKEYIISEKYKELKFLCNKKFKPSFYTFVFNGNREGDYNIDLRLIKKYFQADDTVNLRNSRITQQKYNEILNKNPFINSNPSTYYTMYVILQNLQEILRVQNISPLPNKSYKRSDITKAVIKYYSKSLHIPEENWILRALEKLEELGFLAKIGEDTYYFYNNHPTDDLLKLFATREVEKEFGYDIKGYKGKFYISNATYNQLINTLKTLSNYPQGILKIELEKDRDPPSKDMHHEIGILRRIKFVTESDKIKLTIYGKEFLSLDEDNKREYFHKHAYAYVPLYCKLWDRINAHPKWEIKNQEVIEFIASLNPGLREESSKKGIANTIMSWIQYSKELEYEEANKRYRQRTTRRVEEFY